MSDLKRTGQRCSCTAGTSPCYPQTCVPLRTFTCPARQHRMCTPVTARNHAMTAHARSIHHARTWPETKWTTRRHPRAHPETEISPGAALLNTLMRQADGAAHRGRAVGVTASYHNLILPLPAQQLTVAVTESRTRHAIKHAQACTHTYIQTVHGTHTTTHRGWSWRCRRCIASRCDSLSGCRMSVVNWTDKNKHIAYQKKKMVRGECEGTWRCLSFNLNQETGGSAWGWRQSTEYREHVHLLTPGWLELTAEQGHGVKTKMSLLLNTEHRTGHGK